MVIGPTSDDPNNGIRITPNQGTVGLNDASDEPMQPDDHVSAPVQTPLTLEQNVPNPVSFVTGDWTSIRFYLDRSYPMVRLSLFDQMGSEIKRLYDDAEPGVGWHSVRMNVRDLQSGSYPIVLQAGGRLLRRSLTVIR
jgi:hypothetical protein